MKATVSDVIKIVDTIAPGGLAESWDNVGLQVGNKNWAVRKVWVALDPLLTVVEAACKDGIDLLVTHHPLIFKPLKTIDFNTPVGSILRMAAENEMAIYSAHTNLDSAKGGINDILAEKMGLCNVKPLGKATGTDEMLKLVFYLPATMEKKAVATLLEGPIAELGITTGRFLRMSESSGKQIPSHEAPLQSGTEAGAAEDLRIEIQVSKGDMNAILKKMKQQREFGKLSYDVYPLLPMDLEAGLGRIGDLSKGSDLMAFARRIKGKLELSSVRVAGDPDLPVYSAAVCSGSGSGLLSAFLASRAQVYVTGDLKYHDARITEEAGRGLIDIGHFASEHLMVEVLADMLKSRIKAARLDVRVEPSGLEKEPFVII